jgi:hypothetical protein
MSGFDSRHYQLFWKVVGLERVHSASWVQLRSYLKGKSSGSCLERREYSRRDPSRWQRGTFYPQKLALTSSTSGGRSVGIVRSRTQATEFSFILADWYSLLIFQLSVLLSTSIVLKQTWIWEFEQLTFITNQIWPDLRYWGFAAGRLLIMTL